MSYATDAVKRALTARDVAEQYGLAYDRQGWARCPLHSDRRPSLLLYDGARGWHCFQCGAGGSVIDLVMALHGIAFDQAVVRMDADFHLGLTGRTLTMRERAEQARHDREQREARQQAVRDAETAEARYWAAFTVWMLLRRICDWHTPARAGGITDQWAAAQQRISEAYDTAQRAYDERVMAWNRARQPCAT